MMYSLIYFFFLKKTRIMLKLFEGFFLYGYYLDIKYNALGRQQCCYVCIDS